MWLALGGCGSAATPTTTMMVPALAAAQAATSIAAPHVDALPEGVSAEASACLASPTELCNGRDDDCDGRIDEGCGWSSGPVQITLAWDGGADLDLYVTDPSGFTISYLDRASSTGGVLDRDARGACMPSGPTIENVYWLSEIPPRGAYRVDVHYWGDCGVAGTTTARVSVSIGGHVIGTYDLAIELGQRRAVVAFSI